MSPLELSEHISSFDMGDRSHLLFEMKGRKTQMADGNNQNYATLAWDVWEFIQSSVSVTI